MSSPRDPSLPPIPAEQPRSRRMPPISQWLRLPAHLFLRRDDERIYAAVRIAFAVVALLNVISMWPDRHVFFSDSGMIDRDVVASRADPVYLSVFAFARSDAAVTDHQYQPGPCRCNDSRRDRV